MNLNRLVIFGAVVDYGSFTAAAKELRLTKSMVSQHVRSLEEELGTKLLNRTTRRFTLTEAGELCRDTASRINGEDTALSMRLQQLHHELSGRLRITTSVDYALAAFAAKAAQFAARYPKIELELVVRDGVVDLISERIDVAVRLGTLRDSRLTATKIGSFEQLVLASPAFLAKAGPIRKPSDLTRLDWISLPLLRRPRDWTFTDSKNRQHHERMTPHMTADSPLVVRALLVEGAGISILGRFMVTDELADGRLTRVLPTYTLPSAGIFAVTPTRSVSPKVRAFIDFLKTH